MGDAEIDRLNAEFDAKRKALDDGINRLDPYQQIRVLDDLIHRVESMERESLR